jgi:ribonuclease E
LARDRTRHQVAEVTSLGLVQMTRKRVGGGLLEHFSTPCEHCRGRGVIVTTEPRAETNGSNETNGRERERNGESGGRRTRGRSRRDEANGGRRLPAAIVPDLPVAHDEPAAAVSDQPAVPDEPATVTPDRAEASLDVGAPVPVEPSAVASAVAPATVEPVTTEDVRDDIEEIVVEQALAAERDRHSAPNGHHADADADLGSGRAGETNGVVVADPDRTEPVGRRRRGRVTRTGGAPTAPAGDAPAITVVTVPTVRPADEADAAVPEPPQYPSPQPSSPEPPAPVSRTRRRRAASRPAGPPAPEASGTSAADPV